MSEQQYEEDKDLVARIVKYELDELTPREELELFGELVSTGDVWNLQGKYGRQARAFMGIGWLDLEGNLTALGKDRT